jgi:hypothetical protein
MVVEEVKRDRGKGILKMILYFGIIVLFIASTIFIRRQYQYPLLRWELDKIERIKIIYYGNDYHPGGGDAAILIMEKDKKLTSELYKKIISTKLVVYTNPDELDCQESDPMFEIIFDYEDGKKDTIESTETGRYIFRRLSWNGWVGGPCEDILPVIKNAVARNS